MNNEIEEKLCFLSISEIGLVRETELRKKRKKMMEMVKLNDWSKKKN